MLLALDCEATGLDLRHTSRAFFVTVCDEEGEQHWWEWAIDPLTRMPKVPEGDKEEIREKVAAADELVLQNSKYDAAALYVGGIITEWPWEKTHDTLLAGHLLASNRPHNLTDMAVQYLGVDIQPYEDRLEVAVQKCRRMVQQARLKVKRKAAKGGGVFLDDPLAGWIIAEKDHPDMPSVKDKSWKQDAWLPRAMRAAGYGKEHPEWDTVLRDYANADSAVTVQLWKVMEAELHRRGLWAIYQERRKVLRIAYEMESQGVTLNGERLEELTTKYRTENARTERLLRSLANSYNYELSLPRGGRNKNLDTFVFDVLKLEKVYNSKARSAGPTLDSKNAVPHYLNTLPRTSKGYTFVKGLAGKRSRDTAISYMESYRRFWLPLAETNWYRLHPSLNHCGTDTLRWSSSQPNEQNISKKENFNLRYVFGPAPGREWWSLDAKNIELRIPAYEAEEEDFIALFEKPNEPPYYGSNHLLIAHLLFPKEFEECLRKGESFKDRYKSTIYQDVKNGNFAVQYGAVDREDGKGTADRTYKLPGAQARIKSRFKKQEALNQKWVRFAEKHGYVETMPDRTVDPRRGYPLLVTRTSYGEVLPTVPLNYHVQGTAMWWMMKAMIRVSEQLREWSREPGEYRIALQVHDELVLDFPQGRGSEPWKTNLPKIRKVQRLMAAGGEDIGVPTPVSVEYHESNWSEGVAI